MFAEDPLYQSSPLVRSFVSDINGHPRTLVTFRTLLRELYSRSQVTPTRHSLLEKLRGRLSVKHTDFNVPRQVIINALLRRKVNITDLTVPGDPLSLPYSYYVAMVFCSRIILFFFSSRHHTF
jgi:hypothetical protein